MNDNTKLFYHADTLALVLDGNHASRIIRTTDFILAQQATAEERAELMVADGNNSIVAHYGKREIRHFTYTPYGYRIPHDDGSVLGFNAQRLDPSGLYILGSRAYSPTTHRFGTQDNQAPFDLGGYNVYGYCLGDPVNFTDPSGNVPILSWLKNKYADWQVGRIINRNLNATNEMISKLERQQEYLARRERSISNRIRRLDDEIIEHNRLVKENNKSLLPQIRKLESEAKIIQSTQDVSHRSSNTGSRVYENSNYVTTINALNKLKGQRVYTRNRNKVLEIPLAQQKEIQAGLSANAKKLDDLQARASALRKMR